MQDYGPFVFVFFFFDSCVRACVPTFGFFRMRKVSQSMLCCVVEYIVGRGIPSFFDRRFVSYVGGSKGFMNGKMRI